jgi:hypothetical protein
LHEGIADEECHVRCFAHCLNLAAGDALQCIKSGIDTSRALIKTIKYRRELVRVMEKECLPKNTPENEPPLIFKKPHLNVATRWNSTFEMLQYALEYRRILERCLYLILQYKGKEKVTILRNGTEQPFEALHDADWRMFSDFCSFLREFNDATERCCADKNTTLQIIVPWFNILLDHCDSTMNESLYAIDRNLEKRLRQ